MRTLIFFLLVNISNFAIAQSFEGVWDTSFGRMRIMSPSKEGLVKGAYSLDSASEIEGKIEGSKLRFTYKEKKMAGEGWFDLATDGQTFTGKWREKAKGDWKDWTGQRLKAIPNRTWLLVVEANWEGRVEQKEFAFGDMLKAFFDRTVNVEVRRRHFTDADGLKRWLREASFLREPVAVVIASHGETTGVTVDGEIVPASDIVNGLSFAPSMVALHFSSCLVMKSDYGKNVRNGLKAKGINAAVSGYAGSVDWAISALMEMTYFEFLFRGQNAAEASRTALRLFPIAGKSKIAGVPVEPANFIFLN